MASSTTRDGDPLLLGIPTECRHIIFKHVTERDVRLRDTLRYWFEKTDIQEMIADKQREDPNANVTYVAGYNNKYNEESEPEVEDEDSEEDIEEESELTSSSEDEQDDEGADDIDDDDEDDVDVGDVGDGFGVGEDMMVNDDELESDDESSGEDIDASAQTSLGAINMSHANTGAENGHVAQDNQAVVNVDMEESQGWDEYTGDDEGEDEDEDPSHDFEEQEENEEIETPSVLQDADMANTDGDGTVDATAAQAAPVGPQRRVIKPSSKWRHVPKFMRLTQCPPQSNLFLISKQLSTEAKNWFYDVATLKIDATASFNHFDFFELCLTKLAEAPFSPMENIKKAEITFVWDTTWIRSESNGFAGAVFPVLLNDRAKFVLGILKRAPELQKVVIHWHDSAEDDGAKTLMADTLEPFILNLKAEIEIKEHFIAPDAKPRAKSRAGKQRLEFKAIMDNGGGVF